MMEKSKFSRDLNIENIRKYFPVPKYLIFATNWVTWICPAIDYFISHLEIKQIFGKVYEVY